MKSNDQNSYDDIMNVPHHVSSVHPPMSRQERAAQFSPFAALTGYESAIRETARLTEQKLELEENELEILDRNLRKIREHISEHPKVWVTYFKPDDRKKGGAYITVKSRIKKIDLYKKYILLEEGSLIPFGDIYKINLETAVCPAEKVRNEKQQ